MYIVKRGKLQVHLIFIDCLLVSSQIIIFYRSWVVKQRTPPSSLLFKKDPYSESFPSSIFAVNIFTFAKNPFVKIDSLTLTNHEISGSKNGNRRTANVRSVGYTDLFVLNKNDLWIALKEYPDARRMLLLKVTLQRCFWIIIIQINFHFIDLWSLQGRELLRKDNLLDDDAPDEQASPEEIVDDLLQSINVLQTRYLLRSTTFVWRTLRIIKMRFSCRVARLMAEKTSTEAKLNTRIEILERELVKYKKVRFRGFILLLKS